MPALSDARKRGRPTADERVERRAQILDAALPVFLEHGFGNTTIEQLASAARVTKRTIYAYFGDKDGVFTEMVKSLATTVSAHAAADETLEALCTRIIYRLDSAELIGLHRLVIAESTRFPELAVSLQDNGAVLHIERIASHLRDERGEQAATKAEALFSLMLGEQHRQRLLGLLHPVTPEEARARVDGALADLRLTLPTGHSAPNYQ